MGNKIHAKVTSHKISEKELLVYEPHTDSYFIEYVNEEIIKTRTGPIPSSILKDLFRRSWTHED